jgi:two-component system, OmpR family, phosphate regulon sensor histidine kinase PhoR
LSTIGQGGKHRNDDYLQTADQGAADPVSQSLAASLLEALGQPAIFVGRDDRILFANSDAQTVLGGDFQGRHLAIAMRTPSLLAAVSQCLSNGTRAEIRHAVPLGARDQVYRVTVTPVQGAGLDGVLCLMHDITAAEEASLMRRDFVANVSHELKTPLTALMGFIETLRGPARNDPAAQERFLSIMDREASRMNRLVHDLLQLSRVEAEERIRPSEQVDLVGLVQMTLATLRPAADAARVALQFDPVAEPSAVVGDPDQLTQVFHNLIENAVKYGRPDTVVKVNFRADEFADVPMVRVDVRDHGDGIDPIHLPRLTERFYRVDAHRSRERGGTGLGLAIVKHIVQRHRGRLVIDSTPGKGSMFSVLLPRAAP